MDSGRASAPVGLLAINKACTALYPDQTNPLQVTALIKYWLGGPDPLDYISMYLNQGDSDTPPHWHYVTYGLSDLYGDGRIHQADGDKSGFGFELTFRLTCEGPSPPTWPAELLQSVARYVFSSENMLCPGDHISWHSALDGCESRIQHILLAEDPQLSATTTPHGTLSFIQLVGVTEEELTSAQRWNCLGVLSLLKKHKLTGGARLVTNMRRGETLFDIDSSAQVCVDEGIAQDGSVLSGVNAQCSWDDGKGEQQLNDLEPTSTTVLDHVNLHLNREALTLLPLAIRGRLKHGRHFTYKSFTGDVAVTLVSSGVEGAFAGEDQPLSARGRWLQVYLSDDHLKKLDRGVGSLLAQVSLPTTFDLKDLHLKLTIVPDD